MTALKPVKDARITEMIEFYKKEALGWRISGAGGGGYLVLVSERPVTNAVQIRIRKCGE